LLRVERAVRMEPFMELSRTHTAGAEWP